MTQFIAQIIGLIALLFVLVSFQKNNRYSILLFLIIAQVLFSVHFGLLGAWTGVAMNAVAALRTYVFSQRETKAWGTSKKWLYIFILLFLIFGLITWKNYYSLLPIIAMVIDSFALWNKETKFIRIYLLLPRPFWFIYNFVVGSYAGMITEVLVLFSILAGIFRFDVFAPKKSHQFKKTNLFLLLSFLRI